ncbi:oviduct-specific glycoprotein-like isoform X3 [Antechinus flavipes]|uniref:oviduct-specific glycoprotein-like isoform X1 n=1 Tax=Antechinus flavipes TaxID=38775 RepID=UPI0022365535|nr:oviduct-specific glycoprotein-like isoform X1 [Antechinus flavipes]XP_051849002.1 oviduct-specific glycoprotein-like isoform X2 [Antechinus flavipes]XP_051849003.1 oviduct-specific glycoprotein-like isoform X3 [Antechinus flavipes]
MARLLLWTGLILLLQLQLGPASKLVCYFTSWSRQRPSPASFFPNDVDPYLCTHVVYAFASMKDNKIVPKEKDDEKEIYPQLMSLKKRNPDLRILLSIGGWYFGTSRFTTMMSTFQNRQAFIASVLVLLRAHGFDGLDLFFLYPTQRGSPSRDRALFTELIQELTVTFYEEANNTGQRRLLLTAAVSGNRDIIKVAYQVVSIARLLDYISVLTYDFHGSWESVTGHNSPLYGMNFGSKPIDYLNCEYAMKLWEKQGAPPEKLIMGFPTYGRTFDILFSSRELRAPAFGPAPAGNYTKEAGVWAYYEICPFLKTATKRWIDVQKVPYAHTQKYWVGYDDVRSFAYKTAFIKMKNYGGAMVWTLDFDDFKGTFCEQGPYPLVKTIKQILFFQINATPPPRVTLFSRGRETSPRAEMRSPTLTFLVALKSATSAYGLHTGPGMLTADSQSTSSAAGGAMARSARSIPPRATVEGTSLAPGEPTTPQDAVSSPSAGPSAGLPTWTPGPQATSYNATL